VSLGEATAAMGHTIVKGHMDRITGVVVYQSIASAHKVQTGMFFKSKSTMHNAYRFDPVTAYSQILNNLTSQILPRNIVDLAADHLAGIMSLENSRRTNPVCMAVGVTEIDIAHYALSMVSTMILSLIEDPEGGQRYQLIFPVDTRGLNIDLKDKALGDVHYCKDGMSLLLTKSSAPAKLPRQVDHQAIPDSHLDKNILTSPEEKILPNNLPWTRGLTQQLSISLQIGDQSRLILVSAAKLLGLYEYNTPDKEMTVRTIIQPVSLGILSMLITAYDELYKFFRDERELSVAKQKTSKSKKNDDLDDTTLPDNVLTKDELTFMQERVASHIFELFTPLADSSEGRRLGSRITDLVRASDPTPELNNALRRWNREASFRSQTQVQGTFVTLISAGLLSFEDFNKVTEIFREAKLFTRMSGMERFETREFLDYKGAL
jgi:hypothetical protein